ncbi:MAG: YbgA family protein [Pseudomonadota bacterium]
MEPGEKIPVGISQCLLGDKVRYDGEHKRSRFCTDVLAPYFDFEPICPEVAIGLGIPRPPIRLVEDEGEVRVKGVKKADLDPTDDLREYSEKRTSQLDHLCGYILMQKSPSCGMERVAVYHPNGNPLHHQGVGVYAEVLKRNHPLLPIEESGRLNDSTLRENFIARVYAFYRWKKIENNLTPKVLIDFYSDYKYLVMAHDPQAYHSIGQLLADMKGDDIDTIGEQFIELLMNTLKIPATRKTNTNVLMHIQGYFKKQLSSDEKQELAQVIEQYRQGIIPMIAPMVLIKHFLKQHPSEYLERQAFLNPYPEALSLRNAI